MNNLVTVNNGQVIVSSRDVAENFGKEHAKVMRSIDEIISETPLLDSQKLFFKSTYKTEGNNKSYPEYLMNRDGFTLLAMGFTGKKALEWKLKYIQAFNEMEKRLQQQPPSPSYHIPQTYSEALQLAAEQALQLEKAKPAVEFVDRYVCAENTKSLRETAKILMIPERYFISELIERKILTRQTGTLLPLWPYNTKSLFKVRTLESNGKIYSQVRFTPEGIVWVSQLIRKEENC